MGSKGNLFGWEALRAELEDVSLKKVIIVVGDAIDENGLISKLRRAQGNRGFLFNPKNADMNRIRKKNPNFLSLFTSEFSMSTFLQNSVVAKHRAVVVKSELNGQITSKHIVFWNCEAEAACYEAVTVANGYGRTFSVKEIRVKISEDLLNKSLKWGVFRQKNSLLSLNQLFVKPLRIRKMAFLQNLVPESESNGIGADKFYGNKSQTGFHVLRKPHNPQPRTRKKPTLDGPSYDLRLKPYKTLKEEYLVRWRGSSNFIASLPEALGRKIAESAERCPGDWKKAENRVQGEILSSQRKLSTSEMVEFFIPVFNEWIIMMPGCGIFTFTDDEDTCMNNLEDFIMKLAKYFKCPPILYRSSNRTWSTADIPQKVLDKFRLRQKNKERINMAEGEIIDTEVFSPLNCGQCFEKYEDQKTPSNRIAENEKQSQLLGAPTKIMQKVKDKVPAMKRRLQDKF